MDITSWQTARQDRRDREKKFYISEEQEMVLISKLGEWYGLDLP